MSMEIVWSTCVETDTSWIDTDLATAREASGQRRLIVVRLSCIIVFFLGIDECPIP